MTNRKEINDKVVEWIAHKVKTEYAKDVSLVLLYGSYINGTANDKSDVDCYYIPKTRRGYDLAACFMIDGVGYDLFPISWERVANISELQECMLPLIGDAQILYCSDPCDLERFQKLQEKMRSHLADDRYVKDIAHKKCKDAAGMCGQLKSSRSLSEIRKIAGHVIMTLAEAVAVYNHDYFHFGLKKQYEDLTDKFPDVPQDIAAGYKKVITSLNENDIINNTLDLFKKVCDYTQTAATPQTDMIPQQVSPAGEIQAAWLAGLYEEISSTFWKVYVCCENNNYILAFLSAVCLQRELDDAMEMGSPSYDLLSCFDYRTLGKLAEQARLIEKDLVKLITQNGGHIRSFDHWEAFVQANL